MDAYRPRPGTPVDELDTPCLLVDLDALEHNMAVVARTYRDRPVRMREHTKNIKSPLLAHMQMRAGGTVGGVCTAKVSEAEVMVQGGVTDILIANQVPTREKIERLCALARRADVKVAVDDPRNLRLLSQVAREMGAEIGVLIEVNTSMGRAGVRNAEDAVELARLATELPGVRFLGVMSHQSVRGHLDRATRYAEGMRFMGMCLDVKEAIEAAGLPVAVVSTGETWTYDVAAEVEGVTEVQGGSYLMMDAHYHYMDAFKVALRILGTVVSTPRPGVGVGDVGSRALSLVPGMPPALDGMPGVSIERFFEDHVVLRSDGTTPLYVGQKFALVSGLQDITVDRWDYFVATRNGRVAEVWDIPGRGCRQ